MPVPEPPPGRCAGTTGGFTTVPVPSPASRGLTTFGELVAGFAGTTCLGGLTSTGFAFCVSTLGLGGVFAFGGVVFGLGDVFGGVVLGFGGVVLGFGGVVLGFGGVVLGFGGVVLSLGVVLGFGGVVLGFGGVVLSLGVVLGLVSVVFGLGVAFGLEVSLGEIFGSGLGVGFSSTLGSGFSSAGCVFSGVSGNASGGGLGSVSRLAGSCSAIFDGMLADGVCGGAFPVRS